MSSLVEVEPYQLTVAEPHAPGTEHAENHRETNLLHLAWRNRWLILLCMIIGAVAAWVTLQRVTPRYTAASRVYIDRDLPQILSDDLQIGQSASYLYTQAELIRSTPVSAIARTVCRLTLPDASSSGRLEACPTNSLSQPPALRMATASRS